MDSFALEPDTVQSLSKVSRRCSDQSMITAVMEEVRKKRPRTSGKRSKAQDAGVRHLVVVLGDQLDRSSAAFDGFDPAVDIVWMCEARDESTRVPVSLPRIVMFLSAMRHFRAELESEGVQVVYHELDKNHRSLSETLSKDIDALAPQRVIIVEPGEWGIRESLRTVCPASLLDERIDRHFLCSHEEFEKHSHGRKQLRMEFFYREIRRKHKVLLDEEGEPEGGEWNYDAENRKSFGREGPGRLAMATPVAFAPDAITQKVIAEVIAEFPDNPGRLDDFDWPVTREQSLEALKDFIEHRLSAFGDHQDAMWTGEPWLFHSRISAALNLKLLNPKEVIDQAERAYRKGRAPLASVEGFIRQILGWREYVRGVYWRHMPQYLERNSLSAHEPLPEFFWTGDTSMRCLSECVGQTLRYGYAHHIQRLMVTGLFCLMLGVDPKEVHRWYLAVYVDAVEWVELPNTLGMSQYADGGVMASKPYIATGRYIERMSNYCAGCRFDPAQSTGEKACPFTTLYWDFLQRHESMLRANPRMGLQVKNLARLDTTQRAAIAQQAEQLRSSLRAPKSSS
jgi:deoxyribodipyrimidine photolyase-related protein